MRHRLVQARVDRGWSQGQLVHQLQVASQAAGYVLPDAEILRVTLSGWENGRHCPSRMYERLLCDVLEARPADLGLGSASTALVSVASVGPEAVTYLDSVLALHMSADRLLGSTRMLEVVRDQTKQAESWAADAHGAVRDALLRTGSRYAEFCGWVHQDQGDFSGAEHWTRRSLEMAQELSEPELVAYALMRRSNIATESGQATQGLHLANAALRQAPPGAGRLQALALRQKATAHALRGEMADCRRAIGRGMESVATSVEEADGTSYCTVQYLTMEGGHALAQVGEDQPAVELLTRASQTWPVGQERDKGLCLARLANAHAGVRDPEAACVSAREAVRVMGSAPSARTASALRQLRGRLLPYRRRPDVMDLRERLATAV